MIPNPAWVNRILTKHWDALVEQAPEVMGLPVMPTIAKETRSGKLSFKELGCGHYGCVIATGAGDETVFKLTSDASEAAFVTAALSLREMPQGMIRYQKIVELPETHRGRRVFAIWREEASAIGFTMRVHMPDEVTDRYTRDAWKELSKNLDLFRRHAAVVRDYVNKSKDSGRAIALLKENEDFAWRHTRDGRVYHLRGAQRAAVSLQHCEDIAMTMEHTYASDAIGGALRFYMEQGMLLADVHQNNIGVATRGPDDEYDDWHAINVITDPGHMVPIDTRWLQVSVPSLT